MKINNQTKALRMNRNRASSKLSNYSAHAGTQEIPSFKREEAINLFMKHKMIRRGVVAESTPKAASSSGVRLVAGYGSFTGHVKVLKLSERQSLDS